ncbi:hypothetical protein [Photorhabdus sp. RW14-46]|uniref:hypothetical protein n=1 Tax=Photorhabdus sp. RW14-46 TaxID=2100168 RepID=UPI001F61E7F6|nr:hypothetical protein [Photorhabdus sp. RW14-46]
MKKIKTKTFPKTVRKNKAAHRHGRRFRPDLYRVMMGRIIAAFGKEGALMYRPQNCGDRLSGYK